MNSRRKVSIETIILIIITMFIVFYLGMSVADNNCLCYEIQAKEYDK